MKYQSICECGFVFAHVSADAAQSAMELHNLDLRLAGAEPHYHQKIRQERAS
jgi:hypothetical protein